MSFAHANASVITDQLWIGGDLSTYDAELAGRELAELVEHGLTHILDTREEWSDQDHVAREQPRLHYRWVGIPDLGQRVGTDWFDEVTDFALDALADPGAVLLAHCHAGINRGPSAGFAVLLAQGHDPIEALDLIRRGRPIVMVAYAEDALVWAHQRLEMRHDLDADLDRVSRWRADRQAELDEVLRLHRRADD